MEARDRFQINRAMHAPETWVLQVQYTDRLGNVTERVISPIKWLGGNAILALCLCREYPRQFLLSRCTQIRSIDANEVLMPVPIQTVPMKTIKSIPMTSGPLQNTSAGQVANPQPVLAIA